MQNTDETNPRNLSRHQYGTLKFLAYNNVTMAYLRHAHANTLGSLAYRGYLQRMGPEDDAQVTLSKAGAEALRIYEQASLNERGHEGDLTDRCQRLLKYSRIRVMKNTA